MPDFAVSTAFTSQDRISSAFRRMDKNAGKFGNSAKSAFQKASRAGSRFGDITKGILSAEAIKRGLGLLKRGLTSVITEFASFDDAVISAAAKFSDINLATKEGQAAFLRTKDAAREMGAETEFTATQAAQALDFFALAGFNSEQAIASLPGTIDLATAANADLARSTDIVSDSLGAFGLMTKDNVQLQKNLARTTDVMAKTMTSTNTDIEDLFEAIKKGAPVFRDAGQSMESFNALLGIMANSGIKGAEAGTSLKNMMLRLGNPVSEARTVLEKYNVEVADSQGNFRDVVDIMLDFEKSLKNVGTQQKTAALSTVFGTRAVTGFSVLLEEGTTSLRSFREDLIKSSGATKEMADIMRTSLGKRFAALESAAIELGFKFVDAFEKKGRGGLIRITEAIRNFDMQPVIEATKFAIRMFSSLISILREYSPVIAVIVGGIVAYNAALKVQLALGAIKAFAAFITILHAQAGAWGVLNAIIAANPILFVVTAVTALIAGLIFLQVKFKIFDKLFDKLVSIKNSFSDLGSAIANFFGFKTSAGASGEFGSNPKPLSPRPIIAPNREEMELRRQEVDFKGQLNIIGAPPGSSFEGNTTGAPPIDVSLLGTNP
jgi:TP901 family phage tail tape measure protein